MKRDLTQGNIVKNLMYMALPTMFGFLSQTLYDIVDMIWIGRLSSGAVASVTIFATVYWLSFILNNIIGTSSVSLISQSYGAGDTEKTRRAIEQTFTFKALVAVVSAVVFYVALEPLMRFFTNDPAVLRGALEYGRIRVLFLPIMFSSFTVRTALRCTGDSKSPMYIMMFASVINIILDPIFMFEQVPFIGIKGLGLGVFGAALATVVATTVSFILGSVLLFSGRMGSVRPTLKGLLRLDWEIDKKLITIGLPTGFESLLRNGAQFVTMKFIAFYGTSAVATLGIASRLLHFAFIPLQGLMQGGSTIAGQNLGINNIERAEKNAKAAAMLGSMSMTLFTIITWLFPAQLMRIFVSDPEVIAMGVTVLRVIMPGLIATGLMLGLATVFTGAGYNMPFLISGVVARWGVQLPFLLVTVAWLKLPFLYVAWSFLLSEVVESAIIIFAYKKGKWKTYRAGMQRKDASSGEQDLAPSASQ